MDEDTTTNEESELYQMKRDSWEQEENEAILIHAKAERYLYQIIYKCARCGYEEKAEFTSYTPVGKGKEKIATMDSAPCPLCYGMDVEVPPDKSETIAALQSLVLDLWELLTFDVAALDPQSQATYKRIALPLLMRVYEDRVEDLVPRPEANSEDDHDDTTAQQELEDFEGSDDLPGAGDLL